MLERLLEGAQAGTSAALIVHGEPGIGKTALLEHAGEAASGFTLLRVRSLAAEAELPFAGLSDLVRPILPLLDGIPGPQRAALAGALAVGPPSPGDRFAVAAATLSLLAACADESPVLVLVDDAHWLDAPSREALLFAGRRLDREGVVLLLGMRDREWLRTAGIDTLELHGLHTPDAAALLERAGATVDAAVCDRLVAETGGNPLALLEAFRSLTEQQLRGSTPIAHPLAVGASLEQAFADRLRVLPADTQRGLLVAAASETGSTAEIGQALAGAGLGLAVLEPAEREGIVTLDGGRIAFRHPLVRAASYHLLGAAERRAAHRALAGALGAEAGDSAAWHLVAASVGADEEVASLLERSARSALARNAYAAAASAFEAAARLSPDDEDRLRRTMATGRALLLGGEPQRASSLLESVLELAVDPTVRADLQTLRGAAMLFTHPVSETYEMLVTEASRVEPHDTARAASMLTTATLTQFMAANPRQAEETIGRAPVDRGASGAVAAGVRSVDALVHVYSGRIDEALAIVDPLLEQYEAADVRVNPMMLGVFPQVLNWTERPDQARALLDRIVRTARAEAVPSLLPFPLAILAEVELGRGRLAAAYAAGSESVQLAVETGQAVESSYSLVVLARVEAILGHERACRAHVSTALDFARRLGATSIESYATAALGLLELSLGHPDRAVPHLAECERLREGFGVQLPTLHHDAADLVEAYVRSGAVADASRSLAVLERKATRTGLRWPAAAAARCRGLLAAEDDYEPELARAVDLFGDDMRFERARTLLCLGMRRRRSRRRADARESLHAALAFFVAAGAEPWAEQTRAELRAAGDVSTPAAGRSVRDLTPQELQVALVVASGATNKEAAAALFLSPKTIEFHLRNTYRKLGVRSRSELVRRVGLEGG